MCSKLAVGFLRDGRADAGVLELLPSLPQWIRIDVLRALDDPAKTVDWYKGLNSGEMRRLEHGQ